MIGFSCHWQFFDVIFSFHVVRDSVLTYLVSRVLYFSGCDFHGNGTIVCSEFGLARPYIYLRQPCCFIQKEFVFGHRLFHFVMECRNLKLN